MTKFVKVRFTHPGKGLTTAGLVFDYANIEKMHPTTLSHYFPISEAPAMYQIDVSPIYPTYDEAFAFTFHG